MIIPPGWWWFVHFSFAFSPPNRPPPIRRFSLRHTNRITSLSSGLNFPPIFPNDEFYFRVLRPTAINARRPCPTLALFSVHLASIGKLCPLPPKDLSLIFRPSVRLLSFVAPVSFIFPYSLIQSPIRAASVLLLSSVNPPGIGVIPRPSVPPPQL